MAGIATTPGCDLWFLTMCVVIVIMMSRQISGQVVYDTSVYPADVSVTTITLSNLSIIDVYEISNFPAVTTLDFSYNSLWRIPDLTNVSATLRKLFLTHNNIAAVPADTMVYVPNLSKIDLSYNELTRFPHLGNMAGALEYIDLANNDILTVEEEDVPILPAIIVISLISKYTSHEIEKLHKIDTFCFNYFI